MIQTTFAPCGNPFLFSIGLGQSIDEPKKPDVFDKYALAKYYEWFGKPVASKQAADHFGVAEHVTACASRKLSEDGCVNRIKELFVTSHGSTSWRYLYEFVALPEQAGAQKIPQMIEFLTEYPGANACKFASKHGGKPSSASSVLLGMLKRGLVYRTDVIPYNYWLQK